MSTASVVTSHNPAAGRQSVTLTSWAGDAAFSPAPVSGSQIEGDSSLTIGVDGVVTGADGTYTLHHINASGLIDVDSYVISGGGPGPSPSAQTASVVTSHAPPSGLTLTTLVEPINHYVDQSWTAQAEAGDQILFNAAQITISEHLDLSAEAEGVYSYWYINNDGLIFAPTFTAQNLPSVDDAPPVDPPPYVPIVRGIGRRIGLRSTVGVSLRSSISSSIH